ncbi:MAG: histidinol dehydrogenase [Patescibacteria group bacterium]|nr:histidinol dehydrogenase [Patescibacteria group bacterium]
MKKYTLKNLNKKQIEKLLIRPSINFETVFEVVKNVMADVKENGDKAITKYTERFDETKLDNFAVTEEEITSACKRIPNETKKAFKEAAANIEKFHKSQIEKCKEIETTRGVKCFQESRPIEKVGLYIPGGAAPLPSTVLMLAIPAKIAGCREMIMCTPPRVADIILYAANLTGITKIFRIGGAQAIAALAYGTAQIPKVYKIFGPGNQYVTAAKMLASIDPDGAALDMPAGPSEVLVIADKYAKADFVAADLLSQAEHSTDSQVVLVCTDKNKTDEILKKVEKQLDELPRKEIAKKSLEESFALITKTIEESITFSNNYAPEHLIINVKNPNLYLKEIQNAGSVFIGQYSCESAGDYASGTNHTLPTYGYAKMYSGISTDNFTKKITFQELSMEGVQNLGPIVEKMAETEDLQGHKNAMSIRLKSLS